MLPPFRHGEREIARGYGRSPLSDYPARLAIVEFEDEPGIYHVIDLALDLSIAKYPKNYPTVELNP